MTLHVIARAANGYTEKFGIPRQSGRAVSVVTRIVFEPAFRRPEALRGIEGFSHLWLIWGFSANERSSRKGGSNEKKGSGESTLCTGWSPTVRPPRLGGNTRLGVFATRSPFRPNELGLSSVRLERMEQTAEAGTVLVVSGADLMDGTPIYDIKPYLPYTDIHSDATAGFAEAGSDYRLAVEWEPEAENRLPEAVKRDLQDILAEDPRPAYHNDPGRLYGLSYAGWNIRFRVSGNTLCVTAADRRTNTNPGKH